MDSHSPLLQFMKTNNLAGGGASGAGQIFGGFGAAQPGARQSPVSTSRGTPTGGGLRRTDSSGRVGGDYRHGGHAHAHPNSAWPTQPRELQPKLPQQQPPPPPPQQQQPPQHLHSNPLPVQHNPAQPTPPPEPVLPPAGFPMKADPQPPRPPPPEAKEEVKEVKEEPVLAAEALQLAELKPTKGDPVGAFVEELAVVPGATVVTDTGDLGEVEAVEGGAVRVKTQGGFWLTRPRAKVSRARLFVIDPSSALSKPAYRPVVQFLRTHGRIATWSRMSNSFDRDLQQLGLAKADVEISFGKDDLADGRKQLTKIWDSHPWSAPDTVMVEERRDVASLHEANTIFTPPESGDAKDKEQSSELLKILKDLTKYPGDTRIFIAKRLKGNWKEGRWQKPAVLPVSEIRKPAQEEEKPFRFDPVPLSLAWPPADLRQSPSQEPVRKASHPAKTQHRPDEKKKQQVSQMQPQASAAKGVSQPLGRGAGKKQQMPQPRPGGRGAGRGKN